MGSNAAAGRKAEPIGLKLLKGTKNEEGVTRDSGGRAVPQPPPFSRAAPVRPEHLDPDGAWLWDQVVDQMNSVGLLKPLDGSALEVMCETFSRWREAVRMRKEQARRDEEQNEFGSGMLHGNSQGKVTAPWLGIEERAAKDLRTWFAEFGITPAAEKNLVADVPETNPGIGGGFNGNPFAGK